ncbi:MAG: hypothetical protein INR71_09170, partial [Terriglobus roseus]|nr:hypothetical protein [Terriglobus roseus]
QQAQDLQRTNTYVETLLSTDPRKEKPAANRPSPIKDLKARFSDPPAPPPQQPLPEKPDIARSGMDAIIQPFFRRSDTERPKLTSSMSSPNKSAAGAGEGNQLQITALVDALNTAKKELEAHNTRLREVEEMLAQERQARESAEERAQRLENERKETSSVHQDLQPLRDVEMNGAIPGPADGDASETATLVGEEPGPSKLQHRLEQVLGEMNEMKVQMEKYRARAEKAEEDSARDRATLSEMIEKVRRDEEKRAAREKSRGRRGRSVSASASSPGHLDGALESHSSDPPASDHVGNGDIPELLRKAGLQNGRPVTPEQVKQLEEAVSQVLTATARRRGDQLTHVGPYASILGVVFAGVALMAYLNSWQKGDR